MMKEGPAVHQCSVLENAFPGVGEKTRAQATTHQNCHSYRCSQDQEKPSSPSVSPVYKFLICKIRIMLVQTASQGCRDRSLGDVCSGHILGSAKSPEEKPSTPQGFCPTPPPAHSLGKTCWTLLLLIFLK